MVYIGLVSQEWCSDFGVPKKNALSVDRFVQPPVLHGVFDSAAEGVHWSDLKEGSFLGSLALRAALENRVLGRGRGGSNLTCRIQNDEFLHVGKVVKI